MEERGQGWVWEGGEEDDGDGMSDAAEEFDGSQGPSTDNIADVELDEFGAQEHLEDDFEVG